MARFPAMDQSSGCDRGVQPPAQHAAAPRRAPAVPGAPAAYGGHTRLGGTPAALCGNRRRGARGPRGRGGEAGGALRVEDVGCVQTVWGVTGCVYQPKGEGAEGL
eukprot:gene16538-biopygen13597